MTAIPRPTSPTIAVRVTPKAPRNIVEGYVTDAAGKTWLHVRVTATPEDGKANMAVLKLLAKYWNLPVSSLSVVSGGTSRYKVIRITQLSRGNRLK